MPALEAATRGAAAPAARSHHILRRGLRRDCHPAGPVLRHPAEPQAARDVLVPYRVFRPARALAGRGRDGLALALSARPVWPVELPDRAAGHSSAAVAGRSP